MRVHVIVNHSSGRDRVTDRQTLATVGRLLAEHGVEATLELAGPRHLEHAVRAALRRPVDAILVGGGDGTASTAARVMVEDGRPLGVLPTGTRNHFARDIGMPVALEDAVATIARGETRAVDVGEVNGRVFVNNATLGLYPEVVLLREHDRATTGAGRLPAFLRAVWRATRRSSAADVDIVTGLGKMRRRTSFLLVANNRYELGPTGLGSRARLDAGELTVYVSGVLGRVGLLRLGLGAALGAAALEELHARALVVHARAHRLRVGIDGEVVRLVTPLRYRTRPHALTVLAPRPELAEYTRDRPAAPARPP